MWLITNSGYVSIVEHRDDDSVLIVRARRKSDLQRLFPHAEVAHTPSADYPYRVCVARDIVRRIMMAAVDQITYPNFKASISGDPTLSVLCGKIWSLAHDLKEPEK